MTMYYTPTRPLLRSAATRPTATARAAAIDLYRDGDSYVLNADLPGIDPKSLDIDVDGATLSISAERAPRVGENLTWLAQERAVGTFRRRFTLGDGVDSSAISASYDNGVLSVTIPVSEKAKPRKVAVTVAGSDEAAVAAADVSAQVEAPVADAA